MTTLPAYLWWFIGLTGFALVVAIAIAKLNKLLDPKFRSLQHASSERHARNVLMKWKEKQVVVPAAAAAMLDALLVLLVVGAAEALLYGMFPSDTLPPNATSVERIAVVANWSLSVLMMTALGAVVMANFAADAAMLLMIIKGKPYGMLVLFVRIVGWFKYGVMAIALLYMIFRGELRLYRFLAETVEEHHWKTIGTLGAALLLLLFLVARRLSVFSQQYPPLLALQLASDRLTAKGILVRWGKQGRRSAVRALLLQIALALVYGVTIATLCREVGEHVEAEGLKTIGEGMAWMAIIAAACHVGQNLGALAAVSRADMGWWVGPMRRAGKLRMYLLFAVAAYFIGLLIRLEYTTLIAPAAAWVADTAGKLPLPWSVK